jgi:hypothetical protein
MTVKKLDQFKCDYFHIGAQVLIDANWLQQTLRENEEQIRTQNKAIRTLNIENSALRARLILNDIENDAIYRVDVKV